MNKPVYKLIKLSDVIPTPQNPRVVSVKQPKVIELAESINNSQTKMVYEPILVRIHPDKKGKYDLRDGERRYCASKIAGCKMIPALIHDWDDKEAFEVTVLLNLQREQLTPMEESRALKLILESGDDIETAASRIGKSIQWVKRRASLTRIIKNIQNKLEDDKDFESWGISHLELVAKLDAESQQKLIDGFHSGFGFPDTIRKLKSCLQRGKFYLADAGFDLDKKVAGIMPCMECPKRSACTPELPGFGDDKSGKDMCFDPECYTKKADSSFSEKLKIMKKKYPELILVRSDGYDNDFMKKYKIGYSHYFTKCKKTEKGAIPCVSVNCDTKRLSKTVRYVSKDDKSTSSSTSEQKKKAVDMSLKEKREGLKKKRIKRSMIKLHEDLQKSHYEETDFCDDVVKLENLIALVAAIHNSHWGDDPFKEFKAIKKDGTGLRLITNWIQDELAQYLNIESTLDGINDKYSKQILSLIKNGDKKWQDYMADSTKAIKEPKSWDPAKDKKGKK